MSAIASLCSIERESRVPCIQGVTHEAKAVVRDEGIIGFPEGQTKRRPKEKSCPTDRRDTESQIEQGMTFRAVLKNIFRFEPFIRSWKGISLFEVRSLNIS